MLKNTFVFGLLFLCMTSINGYAGTPSATDSTNTMMISPTQYMYKYLDIDTTLNPSVVIKITTLNTIYTNNCPVSDTVVTSRGVPLTNVQYIQTGVFGQVPAATYLNNANYYNWGGNLWTGVTYVPCTSGCCIYNGTINCPYWIYDYSMLQIICTPVYSDWTAGAT